MQHTELLALLSIRDHRPYRAIYSQQKRPSTNSSRNLHGNEALGLGDVVGCLLLLKRLDKRLNHIHLVAGAMNLQGP